MGNDIKTVDQNPVSGIQVQPSAPIGVANKEVGRVGPPVSEFVTRSGAETIPNIPLEVSAHIKVENNNPDLTFEHKGLVDHAGPYVPVPTSPSGKVTLPMTEKEVANQLKTGQDDDSGKWLAGLIQKIIKAMGI